jgi:hypothetical protein
LSRKILFKFLLASIKILEILPEAALEFLMTCVIVILSSLYNTTDGASKRMLKKPTAHHPPVILKSNTVTRFKIISGLRKNLQNHRRLPECCKMHFTLLEGFSQLVSVFIKASQTFSSILSITRQKQFLKSIGAYTEKTDLIFKT